MAFLFALPSGPRFLHHILVRPATTSTGLADLFTAGKNHYGLEGWQSIPKRRSGPGHFR